MHIDWKFVKINESIIVEKKIEKIFSALLRKAAD